MKTFEILWQCDEYGYINIQAESEDEAREKFETGEFEDKDLMPKNGGMQVEKITEITE